MKESCNFILYGHHELSHTRISYFSTWFASFNLIFNFRAHSWLHKCYRCTTVESLWKSWFMKIRYIGMNHQLSIPLIFALSDILHWDKGRESSMSESGADDADASRDERTYADASRDERFKGSSWISSLVRSFSLSIILIIGSVPGLNTHFLS